MQDESRVKWWLLWPALSCAVPVGFVLVMIVPGIPTARADDILSLIGGLMFGALYVIVPPAFLFWGYAICFDWCKHRVEQEQLSKVSASARLAVLALLLGCIALLFFGALPTSWAAILRGPVAYGFVPAIVAVVRIARTSSPRSTPCR